MIPFEVSVDHRSKIQVLIKKKSSFNKPIINVKIDKPIFGL